MKKFKSYMQSDDNEFDIYSCQNYLRKYVIST